MTNSTPAQCSRAPGCKKLNGHRGACYPFARRKRPIVVPIIFTQGCQVTVEVPEDVANKIRAGWITGFSIPADS